MVLFFQCTSRLFNKTSKASEGHSPFHCRVRQSIQRHHTAPTLFLEVRFRLLLRTFGLLAVHFQPEVLLFVESKRARHTAAVELLGLALLTWHAKDEKRGVA